MGAGRRRRGDPGRARAAAAAGVAATARSSDARRVSARAIGARGLSARGSTDGVSARRTRGRGAHAQLVRERRGRGVRRGIRLGLELLQRISTAISPCRRGNCATVESPKKSERSWSSMPTIETSRGTTRPEVAGGEDRSDRHLVGCREDRGRAVVRHAEQLLRRVVAAADREVGRREQALVDLDARVAQRALVADAAVRGQVEVEVELEVAADVGDAACARGR